MVRPGVRASGDLEELEQPVMASTPRHRSHGFWGKAPLSHGTLFALMGLSVCLVFITVPPGARKWLIMEAWQRTDAPQLQAQGPPLLVAREPEGKPREPEGKLSEPEGKPGEREIKPDDLWAVHDLLLLGYKAPFMIEGSAGQLEVRSKAEELASLMSRIHPYEPCRQQIQAAFTGGRAGIVAASEASWACLPRRFTPEMFTVAFTVEGLDQPPLQGGLADKARNPKLLDVTGLSACAATQWPRTCSLWASIHTMAYRADALGLGTQFRHAVLALLAGGATMCGGCTVHLRTLHETVLSSAILQDLGDLD